MCGIAGIVSLNNNSKSLSKYIHNMGKQLYNRGPDDEGYVLANFFYQEPDVFRGNDTIKSKNWLKYMPVKHINSAYSELNHVALAHRRLSIIDLSFTGHQPMCSDDGRYWIVYNGEVYNFKEIRQELKNLGFCFKGNSDTEVVLCSYQQWGTNMLQKFNGMFSFAIWDHQKKELFCVRDRIGIKPLYYTIQDGMFIFASDIKTIIASKLYSSKINIEGLYLNLSFGIAPRPLTVFKDIYALEQGHWMKINIDNGINKQRYWKLPVGTQDLSMSENDAVNLLNYKLEKAVKKRLISDVPIGTFMSGGIDSTTVSAFAAKYHSGIKAFTLAFDGKSERDESTQARATAQMYQMDHVLKYVNKDIILETLNNLVLFYEEPFMGMSPNNIISQLAANQGVKVVLNGLGGDELFGGYSYYLLASKYKYYNKLTSFLGLVKNLDVRLNKLYQVSTAKSFDRLHTMLFSKQLDDKKKKLFKDDNVQSLDTVERINELYVDDNLVFSDVIEALSYMDIMNYISNHHVHRVDQFTMKYSIEGRLPFLDHELIEAAFMIPSKFKINGKVQKYVLRKVAKNIIHPSCLNMKKKGFSLPINQWLKGPLKELAESKLNSLMQRDIFIPEEIMRRWNQFLSGKSSFHEVWSLVSVEMWFEKFFD